MQNTDFCKKYLQILSDFHGMLSSVATTVPWWGFCRDLECLVPSRFYFNEYPPLLWFKLYLEYFVTIVTSWGSHDLNIEIL